jgi:hypothetical protein
LHRKRRRLMDVLKEPAAMLRIDHVLGSRPQSEFSGEIHRLGAGPDRRCDGQLLRGHGMVSARRGCHARGKLPETVKTLPPRQVKDPEVAHADRCTLVFDTGAENPYVEREVAHLDASVDGTIEIQAHRRMSLVGTPEPSRRTPRMSETSPPL